jgi:hypothetical protein
MRWTYKIVRVATSTDADLQGALESAGDDGWELAALLERGGGLTIVLKRSVSDIANRT